MGDHHNRYAVTLDSAVVEPQPSAAVKSHFNLSEPMEEDILQVVKYCTDLIDDKDLEKLDLIIKYMKR